MTTRDRIEPVVTTTNRPHPTGQEAQVEVIHMAGTPRVRKSHRPVDDQVRTQIQDAARDGKRSRNSIAREFKVAGETVTRICAEAGITFDGTKTEAAVRAHAIDLAEDTYNHGRCHTDCHATPRHGRCLTQNHRGILLAERLAVTPSSIRRDLRTGCYAGTDSGWGLRWGLCARCQC